MGAGLPSFRAMQMGEASPIARLGGRAWRAVGCVRRGGLRLAGVSKGARRRRLSGARGRATVFTARMWARLASTGTLCQQLGALGTVYGGWVVLSGDAAFTDYCGRAVTGPRAVSWQGSVWAVTLMLGPAGGGVFVPTGRCDWAAVYLGGRRLVNSRGRGAGRGGRRLCGGAFAMSRARRVAYCGCGSIGGFGDSPWILSVRGVSWVAGSVLAVSRAACVRRPGV